MNTMLPPECDIGLVELVDFKWLMTAEGHAVNVERLRRDAAYAQQVFTAAEASGNATLRRIAAALRLRLASADPAP
jgi:hypothetical protein